MAVSVNFFSKLARQVWVILAATRTRRDIAYARIREEGCCAHIRKIIVPFQSRCTVLHNYESN